MAEDERNGYVDISNDTSDVMWMMDDGHHLFSLWKAHGGTERF